MTQTASEYWRERRRREKEHARIMAILRERRVAEERQAWYEKQMKGASK